MSFFFVIHRSFFLPLCIQGLKACERTGSYARVKPKSKGCKSFYVAQCRDTVGFLIVTTEAELLQDGGAEGVEGGIK